MAKEMIFEVREVIDVRDGDTFVFELDHGRKIYSEVVMRLQGVDCPERKTRAGKLIRVWAGKWLVAGGRLRAVSKTWDPEIYGRISGDVIREDGVFLTGALMALGLAKRSKGKRPVWSSDELAAAERACEEAVS